MKEQVKDDEEKDQDKSAKNNYAYTIMTNATFEEPVEEGKDAIITITRAEAGREFDSESTVYITTSMVSATEGDYVPIKGTNPMEIKFGPNETEKEFTISTLEDIQTEEKESFYVNLFTTKADAEVGQNYEDWDEVYIKDKK